MKNSPKVKEKQKNSIAAYDSIEDILAFDYYNYRLEVLAKKIKSKNCKIYSKICED